MMYIVCYVVYVIYFMYVHVCVHVIMPMLVSTVSSVFALVSSAIGPRLERCEVAIGPCCT